MPEALLIGWKNVHKLFCDVDGKALIALTTLQQLYGPELKELGIVFRYNPGRAKKPTIAAWPSKVRNWWTRKQQKTWEEKKV